MPQLDIVENFADGTVLTQAQLHQAFLGVEDFVNLIKLDEENIQAGALTSQSLADNSITTAKYATSSITVAKLAQEVIDKLTPTGTVISFAGTAIPSGYLYCDGTAVSRTVYASLFSAIGTLHGNGDASSTFNLPDYRGYFLRGQDDGAGNDPDAAARTASNVGGSTGDQVGSLQPYGIEGHNHSISDPGHVHATAQPVKAFNLAVPVFGEAYQIAPNPDLGLFTAFSVSASMTGITINVSGGNETRPVNKYVRYLIKV